MPPKPVRRIGPRATRSNLPPRRSPRNVDMASSLLEEMEDRGIEIDLSKVELAHEAEEAKEKKWEERLKKLEEDGKEFEGDFTNPLTGLEIE